MTTLPYEFSVDWSERHRDNWDQVIETLKPRRILEIGCYEGRASTHFIEKCSAYGEFEIHCVDTWMGSIELDRSHMGSVEQRFERNTKIAVDNASYPVTFHKIKALSSEALPKLLAAGHAEYFDLAYVDGSHEAPDVLADAVDAFRLVRRGGVMIFDDYIWSMEPEGREDLLNMPKIAVDMFVNLYQRKVTVLKFPIDQLFIRKR